MTDLCPSFSGDTHSQPSTEIVFCFCFGTVFKNIIFSFKHACLHLHQTVVFQEMFIQELAKEAYNFTMQGKRKTLQHRDLGNILLFKEKVSIKLFNSYKNNLGEEVEIVKSVSVS
jgi:hypothetical protein